MINGFERWPRWAKILVIILTFGYFSAIYRIVYYFEMKSDVMTLLFGIISFIPFICFIGWLCDLVTTIKENRITLLLW